MKTSSLLLLAALAVACGAQGAPASGKPDKCGGHLTCPKGCCWDANGGGDGYSCVQTWESSALVCKYVGLSPDSNGVFSKGEQGKDAGR